MSGFNYTRIAATAARLLQRFGRATTLRRLVTAPYDPATGSAATSYTSNACVAAVFPYADRFVDGTLVLATDLQAFLSAAGLAEPHAGDVLDWNGQSLTVVRTKSLGPAGVFVLYELQVRGQ